MEKEENYGKVRKQKGVGIKEAVDRSVAECIKEDVLRDFLILHGTEARKTMYEEFDLEKELDYRERKGQLRMLYMMIRKGMLSDEEIETTAKMIGVTSPAEHIREMALKKDPVPYGLNSSFYFTDEEINKEIEQDMEKEISLKDSDARRRELYRIIREKALSEEGVMRLAREIGIKLLFEELVVIAYMDDNND